MTISLPRRSASALIEAHALTKHYGAGATLVRALDGVDLAIEQGEFVAVVGRSGSGKSTLLHLLGGLDRPTSGQVVIGGQPIFGLKRDELTIFRRRQIGFVFQAYNLVPVLTVYQNAVLPVELDGGRVDQAFVGQVFGLLGLDDLGDRLPGQLSGGQQQRAAIARALATKPALVLADEPTGNLDTAASLDVLGLLKATAQRFGQTTVMITHNEEIAQLADRVVHIQDGRLYHRPPRTVAPAYPGPPPATPTPAALALAQFPGARTC
jgi:putative ABC transport system ATP-binding protein